MIRNLLLISTILNFACTTANHYKQEHILESKKDKNGTLIYKKIEKKYKNQTVDKNIITYQDFDSLGRKIREYGFESIPSPYKSVKYIPDGNSKYLREYYYKGNYTYLYNLYVWPTKIDSIFIPSARFLVSQSYIPDSINRSNGSIKVEITKYGDSISIGHY